MIRSTVSLIIDSSDHSIASLKQEDPDRIVCLSELIDNYTKKVSLNKHDCNSQRIKFYCEECKTHLDSDQSFSFYRLPIVLIVHLKRF